MKILLDDSHLRLVRSVAAAFAGTSLNSDPVKADWEQIQRWATQEIEASNEARTEFAFQPLSLIVDGIVAGLKPTFEEHTAALGGLIDLVKKAAADQPDMRHLSSGGVFGAAE